MNDGGQTAEMAYNLRQEVRRKVKPWCLELPLWSRSLRVAGCADFVGTWTSIPVIADWKTSRAPKKEEWESVRDYKLQCVAYAIMHNELFGTDIEDVRVAITCETGKVQVFEAKVAALKDELTDRIAAYYALPIAA